MITVGSVWPRPIDTPITSLSRPPPSTPKTHLPVFPSFKTQDGLASPPDTNKYISGEPAKRLRPRREGIDASCGLSARQRLSVVSQATS